MTSSSPSPRASMLFYWHENQYDDGNYQNHGKTLVFALAIFSIILFLSLLTLYIHRSCLPQHPTTINTLSLPPSVGGGLDQAVIRSLPVVLYRRETENGEERECCICLDGFEEGEKMKVLPPCCHCYHRECVDRWLKTESSCPICRASIRVDD